MIQIVRWKDIVTTINPDFMPDFERIEKALAHAYRFRRANEKEVEIENKEPEHYRVWKEIRFLMRHAGYEGVSAGNKTIWHERGWYGFAEVVKEGGKEELKFRYIADSPEKPLFISVADLMKFRDELNQEKLEDEYYNTARFEKALATKMNIKPRRDIDFIPEEDVA